MAFQVSDSANGHSPMILLRADAVILFSTNQFQQFWALRRGSTNAEKLQAAIIYEVL